MADLVILQKVYHADLEQQTFAIQTDAKLQRTKYIFQEESREYRNTNKQQGNFWVVIDHFLHEIIVVVDHIGEKVRKSTFPNWFN
jgi:hypothetical protein